MFSPRGAPTLCPRLPWVPLAEEADSRDDYPRALVEYFDDELEVHSFAPSVLCLAAPRPKCASLCGRCADAGPLDRFRGFVVRPSHAVLANASAQGASTHASVAG